MDIKQWVRFEDIDAAYNILISAVSDAFDAEENMAKVEAEVADFWEQLRADPDFKPGRSTAERDAKLRQNNPILMSKYDDAVLQISESKVEKETARLHVEKLKTFLKLASVLVDEEE